MSTPKLSLHTFLLTDRTLTVGVSFPPLAAGESLPRLSVWFQTKGEDRILPLPVVKCSAEGGQAVATYELWNLFLEVRELQELSVTILSRMQPVRLPSLPVVSEGWTVSSVGEAIVLRAERPLALHPIRNKWLRFFDCNRKEQKKMITGLAIGLLSLPFRLLPVHPNRVTICSNRGKMLSGNPAFVYHALQQHPTLDLRILLLSSKGSLSEAFSFFYHYATSRVLLVDDYTRLLSYTPKPKHTKVLQLWHACGAFKTFGFSRLGKDSLLMQGSRNHRQYDAAIVSAKQAVPCYAEGFGIPTDRIYPLGVPRTDALCDAAGVAAVREAFFAAHPALRGKRLLLFAPTFRGGGNGDAYYPFEQFPVNRIVRALPKDSVLLVKWHPYLHERFAVAEDLQQRVLDLSDQSLNDLLTVSDVLITDYSSVVYEAALLRVPMLFYAFDLAEYIAGRDFYEDFPTWIPGKLVQTPEELIHALQTGDFEAEKLPRFCEEQLQTADGHASERVAALILDWVNETEGGPLS